MKLADSNRVLCLKHEPSVHSRYAYQILGESADLVFFRPRLFCLAAIKLKGLEYTGMPQEMGLCVVVGCRVTESRDSVAAAVQVGPRQE